MVNQHEEFIGNPIKPDLVSDDDVQFDSDNELNNFDVDIESEQEFEADLPLVINGVFNFPIPDDFIDNEEDDEDDEDFQPEDDESFYSGSDYDEDVYGFDVDHATFSDSESNPETAFTVTVFPFNKDNSDNSVENKEDSEESDDANINASDSTS